MFPWFQTINKRYQTEINQIWYLFRCQKQLIKHLIKIISKLFLVELAGLSGQSGLFDQTGVAG